MWLIKLLLKRLNDKQKHEILTIAVKDLFNTVNEEDILQEINGQWILGGIVQTEERRKMIMAEAKTFSSSKLWKILQLDIKHQANKGMYERGQTETDLISGKIMLRILDIIRTRLESLNEGYGHFNVEKKPRTTVYKR